MAHAKHSFENDSLDFDIVVDQAVRAIPPAWPLASSVAVNPFLGQTREGLATVAARLARVAGTQVFMPRSWYQQRIADGDITDADLLDALATASPAQRPPNPGGVEISVTAIEPGCQRPADGRGPCGGSFRNRLAGPDRRALRRLGGRVSRRGAGALGCAPRQRCLRRLARGCDP